MLRCVLSFVHWHRCTLVAPHVLFINEDVLQCIVLLFLTTMHSATKLLLAQCMFPHSCMENPS